MSASYAERKIQTTCFVLLLTSPSSRNLPHVHGYIGGRTRTSSSQTPPLFFWEEATVHFFASLVQWHEVRLPPHVRGFSCRIGTVSRRHGLRCVHPLASCASFKPRTHPSVSQFCSWNFSFDSRMRQTLLLIRSIWLANDSWHCGVEHRIFVSPPPFFFVLGCVRVRSATSLPIERDFDSQSMEVRTGPPPNLWTVAVGP